MKQKLIAFCTAALLFAACSDKKKTDEGKTETTPTETKSEEKMSGKTDAPPAMPDSATMMKNWQAYMTPGDMHKMLAKSDGEWNGDVTMWMYPGAPEQKSKSTAVNKMIMNGLYQEANHSGDMMGMPFSGKSIVGFDNHLKQFVSTWIDNMGSGVMVMKGPWDDATKTITLKGSMIDPGTKAETAVKETFKIVDDNNQEMEMFVMTPDGKEFKTMNIKYTRKK
jgi:hypothetical protein